MPELCKYKHKGKRYIIDTAQIKYVIALDQNCLLVLINGEQIEYPYSMKDFQSKNPDTGLLKVHRSYMLRLSAVIDYCYMFAIITRTERIPLNPAGYKLVKDFIDKKGLSSGTNQVS